MSNAIVTIEESYLTGALAAQDDTPPPAKRTPYVAFRGSKTGNNKPELRETLTAAGIPVASFYLADSIGPVLLKPFQYHLFPTVATVATLSDDTGKVLEARSGWKREWYDEKFSENVLAVIGVIQGDAITPALISLRGGLVGAIRPALEALEQAQSPAKWATRGKAFAEVASLKYPFGKFIVTAYGTEEKSQKGRTFGKGQAVVTPSNVATDVKRVLEHVGDPAFQAALGEAVKAHHAKVQAILSGGEADEE